MRKYFTLYLLCLLITGISCTDKDKRDNSHARQKISSVQVVKITPLLGENDGKYFYPQFTHDGSKIVFTTPNFSGLYYYDLARQEVIRLNSVSGSGREYCISADNSDIYFVADTLLNRRRYNILFKQNFGTGYYSRLADTLFRNVSGLTEISENHLVFYSGDKLVHLNTDDGDMNSAKYPRYFSQIQGDKIIADFQDKRKIFSPFPDRNLIWLDKVPGSNLLFVYVAGRGLYSFNTETDSSVFIGDFRAARCSPDGNLIAYMYDEDDGYRTTMSEIFVATLDRIKSFKITNTTQRHEMYPRWSPDSKGIVFHDDSGQIYVAEIQVLTTD